MNINIPTVNIRNTVRKGLSTLDAMLEPKALTIGQQLDEFIASMDDKEAQQDLIKTIQTAMGDDYA
jgi:hypothetical protein